MKWLEGLTKTTLIAALVTPLFYLTDFYSIAFSKAIFFQVLVEISLVGWLILFLKNNKRYAPYLGLVSKTLLAFVAVVFASAVFGSDFYRSIFSTAGRADGALFLLHGAAFVVMLNAVFKSVKEWIRVLRVSTLVGVAIGVYGVLQKYTQLEFINPSLGGRLIGTLGNPDFLGAYSLFLIFLPWGLWFLEQKRNISGLKKYYWKPVYLVCFGLGVFLLLFSGTRGALVGLVAGIIAALGAWLISGRGRLQKGFVVFLLLAVVGSGIALYLYQDAPAVKQAFNKIPVFGRLLQEDLRESTSVTTRLLSVGMGLQSLKDAPLLGQGWSNWYLVFDKYFNPEYFQYTNQWFDKAHNMPLEVLVTTGVVGFVFYLSIFGLALKTLWSNKKGSQAVTVVIVGLLAAYFTQNLALFDTPTTWVMLFLTLAFIDQLPQPGLEQKWNWTKEKFKLDQLKFNFDWQAYLAVVLLVVVPFVFYLFTLKPFVAAQELESKQVEATASYQQQRSVLSKGTVLNYHVVIELGESLTEVYAPSRFGQLKPYVDLEIKYLKKQIDKHPNNIKLKLLLARMYNYKGSQDEQYFVKADKILKEAVRIAPKRPEVLVELCTVKMKLGNYSKAVDYCQPAVNIRPDSASAQWKLTAAYSGAEQYQQAAQSFEQARKKGINWKTTARLNELVSIYNGLGNYQQVNRYYNILIGKKPNNAQYRISYALSLSKAGKYERAVEQMEKVIEMKPRVEKQAQPYLEKWRREL